MPTKIPAIGSSNWGNELNMIFDDTLVSKDWTKGVPGTDFAVDATAYIDPRSIMHSDVTFYVSPSGDDANDGLTSGTAFATAQKALMEATQEYQFSGHVITIQFEPGTYDITGGLVVENSANTILLKGDEANPTTTKLLSDNYGVTFATQGAIMGMTVESTVIEVGGAGTTFTGTKGIISNSVFTGFENGVATEGATVTLKGSITCTGNTVGFNIGDASAVTATDGILIDDGQFNINIDADGVAIIVSRSSSFRAQSANTSGTYDSTIVLTNGSAGVSGIGIYSFNSASVFLREVSVSITGFSTGVSVAEASVVRSEGLSNFTVNSGAFGISASSSGSFFHGGLSTINASGDAVSGNINSVIFLQNANLTGQTGARLFSGSRFIQGAGTIVSTGNSAVSSFGVLADTRSEARMFDVSISCDTTIGTGVFLNVGSIGGLFGVSVTAAKTAVQCDFSSTSSIGNLTGSGLTGDALVVTGGSLMKISNSNLSTSGSNGALVQRKSTLDIDATVEDGTGIVCSGFGIYATENSYVNMRGVKPTNILAGGLQLASVFRSVIRPTPQNGFGDFGAAFTQGAQIGQVDEGFIYQA